MSQVGAVVEVVFAVFFDDLLVAVRPLRADLISELPDFFL
jgi:hypothetical protein